MRTARPLRPALALAAGLLCLAAPASAGRDPAQVFFERSLVLTADARCGLFNRPIEAALRAGALQARGAALRAGSSEARLNALAEAARRQGARGGCAAGEVGQLRQTVTAAFNGWSRQARMSFPASTAAWSADRYALTRRGWRLVQWTRTGASPVGFGLDDQGRTTALVAWRLSPRPVPGAVAPQGRRRAEWAAGSHGADGALLPGEHRSGQAWTFSPATAEALAQLDPRERFAVEFLFRDDSVARAEFEAGDWAAARAFLELGPV
jgi:hypothetical protein